MVKIIFRARKTFTGKEAARRRKIIVREESVCTAFITKAGETPTSRQNKKSQPGGSKTHMLIGSRSWIDFVRRRRR